MKYEGSYDSFPLKHRVVINIVTLYTGGKEWCFCPNAL